jgi:hypothetical protein
VWHLGSATIQLDYLDDTVVTLGRATPALPWLHLDATPSWFFDTLSPAEIEVYVMAALKRVVNVQVTGSQLGRAQDRRLQDDAPLLHAHLTDPVFEDGTPRKPSSLFIFSEGGVWKACLGERNDSVNLWAESDTFFGLLVALEGRLGDATAAWRPPSPKRKPR